MVGLVKIVSACAAFISTVSAVTIAEINGNHFLSPYSGQSVANVTGLVTAKTLSTASSAGIWLRSITPDNDDATSESIFVFSRTIGNNLTVGDIITIDARVQEYRSSTAYLYLTELSSPTNIRLVSRGNTVTPYVVGSNTGLSPITDLYSSLDTNNDIFAVPNNQSRVSQVNPQLNPRRYGLDYWEGLSGELVTIQSVIAIDRPNSYGEFWTTGNWRVSGRNSRGGLTIRTSGGGDTDANPETIIIGSPLDGSKNPTTIKLGDSISDITGVIYYQFGFYYLIPTTAVRVLSSRTPALPPAVSFTSSKICSGLTLGQYNVENLDPSDGAQFSNLANHIVNYLRLPTLMFLQEIQDNNGATNNGVVDANVTLATLVAAIATASGSNFTYAFTDIPPVDGTNGGEPGGNIRNAYLYDPSVIRLRNPNRGGSTQAVQVLPGPELSVNPGLIDPTNSAWTSSRKPLVAEWETLSGDAKFFTVNVHWTSKGGSSSLQGDPRPPVNGGVSNRQAQSDVTSAFIKQILAVDSAANVITAGDFNEFEFVAPIKTFMTNSQLRNMDDVAGIPDVERYTYLFDMNSQELDHMFVSQNIASKGAQFAHVHVNTWVSSADEVSDHDPSVAKMNVCTGAGRKRAVALRG